MRQRIFIAGYFGFGNTGDEAILASMLRDLRRQRPELLFTVTSAEPDRTAAAYGIEAVLWCDIEAISQAVRASDLVLLGGGGIFHDYWGFDVNSFLTDNHSGIGFYTGPAVLAHLYGKPLMLYGVGVGPLPSEHGARFTRVACELAQVVTVRDEGSRDLLLSIGAPADRITVTADPVFGFEPVTPVRMAGHPLIAVSVRHWDIGVNSTFWETELAAALDDVLSRHPEARAVFIPFQSHSGQRENDTAVIARIAGSMRFRERVQLLEPGLEAARIAAILAGCDAVLGMRLHSLIFAAAQGVPVAAIEYDGKVRHLMNRLGLADFCLDLRAMEAGRIARTLARALDERESMRTMLSGKSADFASLAGENARRAVELLDRPVEHRALSTDAEAILARGLQALIAENSKHRKESQRLFALADRHMKLTETLSVDVTALNRQLVDTQSLIEGITAEKAGLQKKQAASVPRDLLLHAEESRKKVVAGLDQFQQNLQKNIAGYRNQRAWQVMLAIRKAYTLLLRKGLRGKLEFLPWMLGLKKAGLAEYDLTYPEVWNYMPERLEVPYLDPSDMPEPPEEQRAVLSTEEGFTGIAKPGKYDVIVLAIFNYEFRYQRPQQIATQFARNGHRVFWISPGRLLPLESEDAYETLLLRDNLWEVHIRTRPIELYTGELTPAHAQEIHNCLVRMYRDFNIAESCVYMQFPYWRQISLDLREKFGAKVLYDCMDDWQNWTTDPVISKFSLDAEKLLAKEADAIVVTSQDLAERFEGLGAKPVLARNGADYEFFASPRTSTLLEDLPRPIIGYYGAIADWFDLQLIHEVVKLRPQYTFAFIGHVYNLDLTEFVKLPNVRMLGEKNYRDLPMYLSKFDVCLVPFVLNELTKAVDPVKMYEYLSQGKPVVATDMAELAKVNKDVLYIGKDAEDFAAKIDQALAGKDDPDLIRARIAFAKANTWAARVDAMDARIRASFPMVSLLIVTYNCEEFLIPCLDSIERNTAYPSYEIIVVDNNSNEQTRNILRQRAADNPRIHLQLLDRNTGFAGGNNIAARNAKGEYLVFLNPDTIVTPGWLNRMVEHYRRDPKMGLVCAVTNFSGNETKINFEYTDLVEMERFALRRAEEHNGEALDVSVVPLFCVMAPMKLWEQLGELDEDFQVGMFEDDDFSLRFRKAGYRVITAEDCFVHHFGNGSFAKIPSEESLRIFEKNKERFETKWGMEWQAHKLRAGVKPPYEDLRFHPVEFVKNGTHQLRKHTTDLVLVKLYPSTCVAGKGFNVQPNGYSAISVDCQNATPSTVIAISGLVLHTNYAGSKRLTALVPPHICEKPGIREVYLLNDFGQSNALPISIAPAPEAREASCAS